MSNNRKNYKLLIQYDGTRYSGWQRLPGKDTIQGKLEQVLSRMCGQEIEIIGAGRTDAGVHAKGMVANVHLPAGKTPEEIRSYLNEYLPEDIAVLCVEEVDLRFHARYNATGKTYCYTCYVGNNKPVFDRKYCYVLKQKPDVERMRQVAKLLMGTHDFRNFSTNSKIKKSTIRCVNRIEIQCEGDYLTFSFHGDGFLWNMVRVLVGTLLEVGWGQRSEQQILDALDTEQEPGRSKAGATAPAQGLCLMQVDYEK